MKKFFIWFLQCLTVLYLLSFGAAAADAPHEGYIIKLNDFYPRLLSADVTPAGLLVVDTMEDAEAISKEYIEYIEPNYLVELFDDAIDTDTPWAPSDVYYQDYQQPLQAIDGLALYRAGLTGDGVKVAFVDSGINAAHEDLDADRLSGVNFHSDGLAYDQDSYGHGTFAAGILAAQTDNGRGLAGMAPQVQIRAYRAFSTKTTTLSCVASAIDQAVADGCQILNLSLGLTSDSTTLRNAVSRAVDAGVIVVAAVGNSGTATSQYPAAYEGVIGVGSVGLSDGKFVVSSFSQRNETVFVTAPGQGIAGLGYLSADSYRLDLTAASNQGTSYAAPVITALAALALDYDEDITADGVRYLLRTTALDKGAVGYDTDYGYGVVDPAAYLAELQREFEINYELNGGQVHEDLPASYRATSNALLLSARPMREGYLFSGWYTDAACTEMITEIPAGSLGDVTVYAGWVKAPFFTGLTEEGKLRIYAEGQTEACLLLCADYTEQGQLTAYTVTSIVLEAGDNDLELPAPPSSGSCRIVFLTDEAYRPVTAAMPIGNLE